MDTVFVPGAIADDADCAHALCCVVDPSHGECHLFSGKMAAGIGPCPTFVLANDSRNGDHAIRSAYYGAPRWRGVWYRKSNLDSRRSDRRGCISVGLGPQGTGLELFIVGLGLALACDRFRTSPYRHPPN